MFFRFRKTLNLSKFFISKSDLSSIDRINGFSLGRRYASHSTNYDLIVIGGGPAGYCGAIKASQLGLKTACIEKRSTLGGTCLNIGCIPSKALLQSSYMYSEALHGYSNHGVVVKDVQIDLPAMMKQKDGAVTNLTKGIEFLFKKNGVDYIQGSASLESSTKVKVDFSNGQSSVFESKNTIIATGSSTRPLQGIQIDEKRILSSTGMLSIAEIPKSLLVIGGGYIGLELGSVWNRLGSEVTVVEFGESIVPSMDSELRKSFQKCLEKQGIKFKLKTNVTGAEVRENDVHVTVQPSESGEKKEMNADVVLVAAGRMPYTDGLNLKETGVDLDLFGRILVDRQFQTSVPGIYAVGDVIPGPMLAHKAEDEALACVEIIAGGQGYVNYDTVPGIIYTHPEVAAVGMTEEQVLDSGIAYSVGKFPFQANSRARTINDAEGMVKIIANKHTDQVMGVHILGAQAGELISQCVLAMEYGAASEDIARTCIGHPTFSEAVKEAAMATYSKPIHY